MKACIIWTFLYSEWWLIKKCDNMIVWVSANYVFALKAIEGFDK